MVIKGTENANHRSSHCCWRVLWYYRMDLPLVCTRFSPGDNPEDTPVAKKDSEGLELEGLLEGNQSQDEPWRSGINGAKRANVK